MRPWSRLLDDAYRREGPRLSRFIRRRLRGSADEQDLLHDAFVRLAARQDEEMPRNPQAYLQRIVRNLLVDRGRRPEARIDHCPIDQDIDLPVPADQTYGLEAAQLKRRYREAVAALPKRTREVFLLHRLNELGYDEIAMRLGISSATVRWHVAQAILSIGEAIGK